MYPTKTPWLFALQMLVIGAAVITCLIMTANPLAMLGLLLAWESPPIVPENNPSPQQDHDPETGRPIGFVHEE